MYNKNIDLYLYIIIFINSCFLYNMSENDTPELIINSVVAYVV